MPWDIKNLEFAIRDAATKKDYGELTRIALAMLRDVEKYESLKPLIKELEKFI